MGAKGCPFGILVEEVSVFGGISGLVDALL